jgi:hypothetical protein
MKRRFPKLAGWLAVIYLFWSLFVFFGTLGSEGHDWWPLFLYFVIWPLSALYEALSSVSFDWLIPDPKSAASWVWTLNDYIAGAFYIVVGTIWVWCLGRVFSIVITRIFPLRHDKTVA